MAAERINLLNEVLTNSRNNNLLHEVRREENMINNENDEEQQQQQQEQNGEEENNTVDDALNWRERMLFYKAFILNVPIIFISFWFLIFYWNAKLPYCGAPVGQFLTVEMLTLIGSVYFRNKLRKPNLDKEKYVRLKKCVDGISAFRIIWMFWGIHFILIVPNRCERENPHLYYLSLAVITFNLVQTFFPLIILILGCVFIIISFPCVLRGLRRMRQYKDLKQEITQEMIDQQVTSVAYSSAQHGAGLSCAICLGDYQQEEIIRTLPCSHLYHKSCVDEWFLSGNQTCPNCRKQCITLPRRNSAASSNSTEEGTNQMEVELLRQDGGNIV